MGSCCELLVSFGRFDCNSSLSMVSAGKRSQIEYERSGMKPGKGGERGLQDEQGCKHGGSQCRQLKIRGDLLRV